MILLFQLLPLLWSGKIVDFKMRTLCPYRFVNFSVVGSKTATTKTSSTVRAAVFFSNFSNNIPFNTNWINQLLTRFMEQGLMSLCWSNIHQYFSTWCPRNKVQGPWVGHNTNQFFIRQSSPYQFNFQWSFCPSQLGNTTPFSVIDFCLRFAPTAKQENSSALSHSERVYTTFWVGSYLYIYSRYICIY